MYGYSPPPQVSPLRHLPSLPVIHTPMDIRRSGTITPTGHRPIEEDNDITPRPLRIGKVKKSPSMPFRKRGKGTQEGKEKDREAKKGFLGMSFPPSPKVRSSSAGVLDKERLGREGEVGEVQNSRAGGGKGTGSSPGAARMAWLQRPAAKQMASIPDSSEESNAYRGNSTPTGQKNSDGYESRDSSIPSEDARLLPYSDGQLVDKSKKITFLRRAASTGAGYGRASRQRLEQRRSEAPHRALEESSQTKSPPRGWKQMAMDLFQGSGVNSATAVKRANSKRRERSESLSSTKSVLSYPTPPQVSPPMDSEGSSNADRPFGGSLPRSFAASGMWQLDGPDGSKHCSHDYGSTGPRGGRRETSTLGIFEGNIGGRNRTRPQKSGQWKAPMLALNLVVTPEWDTLALSPIESDKQNGFWISVEIEGRVSTTGHAGQPQGVGLDVGVLMDLSPYTSRTSFSSMKSQAKRIVESMESARDRVAVMTFPCAALNSVHTLNASGSVARQQLLDDIMSLSLPHTSIAPSSRNVKGAVMASIRKLKAMPSDATRYPKSERSVHLFLLTSQLDDGAIELLPEVFMGQVQIHILGIGSVFWPRNEMGSTGWCVPLSTFGPRPGKDDKGGKPVSVEAIIGSLRTAVDLGEARDVIVHLRCAGDSRVLEVVGDTEFPRLVPGEKRSLLVKVEPGKPSSLGMNLDGVFDEAGDWTLVERHINAIQADLGVYETPLLRVKLTYQHSNLPKATTLCVEKTAKVHRYNGESHWRSTLQQTYPTDPEKSPKPVITHQEYVHKIRTQKAASMYSNPDRALQEVQAISAKVKRGEVPLDLHDISRELSYRSKMEKRYSNSTITSPGEMETIPRERRLSFASDATDEVLEYWREGKLPDSPTPDPIRLALEESDADGDGDDGDGEVQLDEAQKIWRDMKARRHGGSSRIKFDGTGGRSSVAGKSHVTLRDVRETDFGPWRV